MINVGTSICEVTTDADALKCSCGTASLQVSMTLFPSQDKLWVYFTDESGKKGTQVPFARVHAVLKALVLKELKAEKGKRRGKTTNNRR